MINQAEQENEEGPLSDLVFQIHETIHGANVSSDVKLAALTFCIADMIAWTHCKRHRFQALGEVLADLPQMVEAAGAESDRIDREAAECHSN